MGRIKTKQIKRITNYVMKQHGENFSDDFDENKNKIVDYAKFPSKKLKNVISGYVTRLTKNKEVL